jgi:hypothetical protein
MRHIRLLIRKQLFEDRKGLVIYAVAAFGAVFLFGLFRALTQNQAVDSFSTYYSQWFNNFLFFGGLIVTSITFSESMHSKIRQHEWMTLPAHAHEKLIAKIIYLALLYPAALLIFMTISSLVTEGAAMLIIGRSVPIFRLYETEVWRSIGGYLVLNAVFLLGASYFTSAHFMKTVLSLILITLVFGLFAALIARVVYAPYIDSLFRDPYLFDQFSLTFTTGDTPLLLKAGRVISRILQVAIVPFCYLVTYLRIREKEALNAV